MKIALVCGHFMPEIGYQEVYLAKAYARAGHELKVFTSVEVSPNGVEILNKKYVAGETTDNKYGFSVLRLPTLFSVGSKVISLGLKKQVKKFNPDRIIILGVAKFFPLPILSESFYRDKKIAIFGDAEEYKDTSTVSKKIKTTFSGWLKKFIYKKAIVACTKIVLNIPEAETFINNILSQSLQNDFNKKKQKLTLGYDSESFFFDENSYNATRKELKISEEAFVLITSTRVNKRKNIGEIIQAVSSLKQKGLDIHYIIIGFMNDSYSDELNFFITKQPVVEIFHCFPFLSHEKIRQFYSAADAGLWVKAAISIQESMGTGLQVLLENKQSVSHLVQENVTGWYYEKDTMEKTIEKAYNEVRKNNKTIKLENRKNRIISTSQWLSYDAISKKIIQL